MSIHIYRPQTTDMKRKRVYCSNCKKMTLSLFKFYEWYEPLSICLSCANKWNGGVRIKPNKYAVQRLIAEAKESYAIWCKLVDKHKKLRKMQKAETRQCEAARPQAGKPTRGQAILPPSLG
jgi:hypothetical protein